MDIKIITLFYNSTNYGGILQSYALTKKINEFDNVKACQICYTKIVNASKKRIKLKKIFNLPLVCRYIRAKIIRLFSLGELKKIKDVKKKRSELFSVFVDKNIPKTLKEYNRYNIKELIDETDVFLAGSDQVWNVNFYDESYRLEFVPSSKYKFSYAAGVSSGVLTDEQQEVFKKALTSFDAISVREKNAIDTLQALTDKRVEWVLDPTLLLSDKDWDQICSERKVKEKYVFCYFLGALAISNKKITKFAKSRNLKVVCMPYLWGTSKKDSNFGDYKIYDAAPHDFISLIKYAEYVFTDSFHATVFSHIYKKNFFVFNRAGFKSMNDRIYSLTSLFDTQERFCDTTEKGNLGYIESLPSIDYNRPFPKFDEMKEKSVNFLKENLKKAEEKIYGNK